MGFFSFLKYTFIIFAAYLATSCGTPFENHCVKQSRTANNKLVEEFYLLGYSVV
jgi:hypothetical protein